MMNTTASDTPAVDPNFARAQEVERTQRERESKLSMELETLKRQLSEKEELTTKISRNGWDLNTLLTVSPQSETDTKIVRVESQIESLKKELEMSKAELQMKEEVGVIKDFLNKNKDEYELIDLYDYQNKVYDIIKYYKKTENKTLTMAEASTMLETELETYEKQKATKVKSSKKVKSFYTEAYEAPQEAAKATYKSTPTTVKEKESHTTLEGFDLKAFKESSGIRQPKVTIVPIASGNGPQNNAPMSKSQKIASLTKSLGKK